ncbi:E3 ubiquitin-protein ligase HERC1 [Phytophthora nicotianae]|uniref:E3 ubiquitin-protein ligase HERC1 n=1 Tax=Phytophthora nicotianae TaxID=4792 RepID=A0A0W8C7K7_PHYNI|nr:E3 ubiquitin-protein ligase HERC1 [Phytophthora nicotianae]
MELPEDLDGFHAILKRRIRNQSDIESCRQDSSAENKVAAQRAIAAREWRIGDVNTAIVGPRDQWQQYTWGNAERLCLYSEESVTTTKPTLTPSIQEKIRVHDSKNRILTIGRDAKFVAVASGKYHTLMLSELPTTDSLQQLTSKESRQNLGRLTAIERMARSRAPTQANMDYAVNAPTVNNLFSWGRGDYGVLGHGDTRSCSVPRVLKMFNSLRVTGVSAGLHHALVLTELDGVYAFGDGSNGKLGMESYYCCRWRSSQPSDIRYGNILHQTKDNERFLTSSTIEIEMPQGVCVWSWGSGSYGQLGHRDIWDALIPRSVDEIRHENIRFINAGQRHSLAISERFNFVSDSGKFIRYRSVCANFPYIEPSCRRLSCPVYRWSVPVLGEDVHLFGVIETVSALFIDADHASLTRFVLDALTTATSSTI